MQKLKVDFETEDPSFVIVKTQPYLHFNLIMFEIRHSTHLEPTPHHPTPSTHFSTTSRHASNLKFGTDTH